MLNIQALMDSMSALDRKTRASYHLTLGAAIEALSAVDPAMTVTTSRGGGVGEADSYRGYYADLALAHVADKGTAAELLATLKAALNNTFTGYKGGDFVMDANTPLWAAGYGDCGPAIVDMRVGEQVVLVLKDV